MPKELSSHFAQQLKEIKRDFHCHPELGLQEKWTTQHIQHELQSLDMRLENFDQDTGVVAVLHTGKPGPVVALRADIDALPIDESPSHNPRSQYSGRMHACGHDAHITCLLGAAMLLNNMRNELNGDVIFVFQPDEETSHGAKNLIEAGLLNRFSIKAMFGLHVRPEFPSGTIGVRPGAAMSAKDRFTITIQGRGGHGAMPHMSISPIPAGIAVIQALQTIVGCRIDPRSTGVISVCAIHAGTADNVFPSDMVIMGNLRADSVALRAQLRQEITDIVHAIPTGSHCTGSVTFDNSIELLYNSPELLSIAAASASSIVGSNNVIEQPFDLTSEDFSEFSMHVPSFFYFLGASKSPPTAAPLHSPEFVVDDDILPIGARLLAESVLQAQASFV